MATLTGIHAGHTVAVLLVGAGLLSACAEGQSESRHQRAAMQSTGQSSAKADLSDANIVSLLAVANESDIEGGQLAQEKAASPEVRAYGARMITDHSALLQQGNNLSRQLMINPVQPELAQQLMRDHQRSMDQLTTMSGEEFDRAYIEHEIKMHQKVIRLVDESAKAADAQQLRMLLERSRPALQDHLEQAQQVKQSLVASR